MENLLEGYDVTNLKHPGGKEVFERERMTDKELNFFLQESHNKLTDSHLEKYFVGKYKI